MPAPHPPSSRNAIQARPRRELLPAARRQTQRCDTGSGRTARPGPPNTEERLGDLPESTIFFQAVVRRNPIAADHAHNLFFFYGCHRQIVAAERRVQGSPTAPRPGSTGSAGVGDGGPATKDAQARAARPLLAIKWCRPPQRRMRRSRNRAGPNRPTSKFQTHAHQDVRARPA